MKAERQARGSILWKLLGAILLALLLAVVAGYTLERLGVSRDLARLPMPGRMVSVGSHRLHLSCQGEGSPVILLESGWGMPAAVWVRTQPLLAKQTRTCVYDRAGYGWSEAGPAPRDAAEIAKEAEALLTAARIEGPLVLVGHSFGGLCVRLLAKRMPKRVAGLVLVDAVHEDMLRALPMIRVRMEERRTQMELAPYLADLSLFRIAPGFFGMDRRGEEAAAFSDAQWETIRTFRSMPRQVEAALAELLLFEESMREARAAGGFGSMPLVVLSAGLARKPRWVPPDYTDAEYQRQWNLLQEKMRSLSNPPALHFVAPNSAHEIPIQQPEMVVRAVDAVLRQVAITQSVR